MPTPEQIAVMAKHYIIAALWASADEGTHPRPTLSALAQATADCVRFCELAGTLVDQAAACEGYGAHPDCGNTHPAFAAMGHDLWLTRCGHGAGFWDRDELRADPDSEIPNADELGDELTNICERMGEPVYEFYRGWFYLREGVTA